MVNNGIAIHDVSSHQVFQFFSQVGTMHARGDENGNVLRVEAVLLQGLKQGGQNNFIGYRTGEIGNDHTGGFFAPGQFRKGAAFDGIQKGGGYGLLGIGEPIKGFHFQGWNR